MTGSLVQIFGWRREAADAEGGWCSLLEGVFLVSAQEDIAGLHRQRMLLMLRALKRNFKRLYPWCYELFLFLSSVFY